MLSLKLFNRLNKFTGESSCLVEPDADRPRHYLIHVRNDETKEIKLVARFSYQLWDYGDYLYTFVIGQKAYQVRSSDLRYRRLALIDALQLNSNAEVNCPDTLFQISDAFTSSNKQYHVTINDDKRQYAYLAITLLISLHERP